jgi:hypothetical protein
LAKKALFEAGLCADVMGMAAIAQAAANETANQALLRAVELFLMSDLRRGTRFRGLTRRGRRGFCGRVLRRSSNKCTTAELDLEPRSALDERLFGFRAGGVIMCDALWSEL